MAIYNAIMAFTNWMWTFPILALLIGGGLVITVACDFVQIKHFGYMLKATFGDAAHSKSEEGISSWSAMVATLANTIGTGNIIGVGSAIALGGPGAVFWMWVIGFVAMALKYSEALLGVYTREKDANGQWRGGANIYLAKIWKPLGWIWAITCCFGMAIGCGVHTGAISSSVHTFGVPSLITTVVCCVIIVLVILGGLGALVKVTDKLVPAMAIIYMAAGTLLIILNIQNLIPALISVFTNAFTGTAATGGFAGAALAATIKNGCSRGVYSNDGGNGSASILHAQANTNEPVKQGMFGIFEVFMCTMIICTFSSNGHSCHRNMGDWRSWFCSGDQCIWNDRSSGKTPGIHQPDPFRSIFSVVHVNIGRDPCGKPAGKSSKADHADPGCGLLFHRRHDRC